MKVIDLLNKIANEEEVPKKIMFLCDVYELSMINEFTYYKNGTTPLLVSMNDLNYEVEVIGEKEETKTTARESIEALGYACGEIQKCFTNGWEKSLKNKSLIEEDKKIRKIKVEYNPDIEEKIFYEDGNKPRYYVLGDAGTELLINKINEIINKINGGTND